MPRAGPMTLERPLVSRSRFTMIGGEIWRECVMTLDCAQQLVRLEAVD